MNTQSLTPETDSVWNHSHSESMLLDHARKLERERDELRAVVRELIKGIAAESLLTPSAPSCDG